MRNTQQRRAIITFKYPNSIKISQLIAAHQGWRQLSKCDLSRIELYKNFVTPTIQICSLRWLHTNIKSAGSLFFRQRVVCRSLVRTFMCSVIDIERLSLMDYNNLLNLTREFFSQQFKSRPAHTSKALRRTFYGQLNFLSHEMLLALHKQHLQCERELCVPCCVDCKEFSIFE
jgi:hypothetical protein